MMNLNSSLLIFNEAYVPAAPDLQLSLPQSNLLTNLLKEEDQYQYNELINTSISIDIQPLLHQLCSLLHLSSSATWMATILLKKLTIQQPSLDFFAILACVTLSSKYQDSSSQSINYELLAQYFHIDNIQHIHDAELKLLDVFSYDIHVTTPDHFFSYLSNVDNNFKQIVDQARSLLSMNSLSHQTYDLLHNYPCSIVALSLMYNITSNAFIIEQIKSFAQHKKDPSHYLSQLLHCIDQLQTILSQ